MHGPTEQEQGPGIVVRILGVPTLSTGEAETELRGRLRDFVAVLALSKGGDLTNDEIVRDLWEDGEPKTARAIVHNLASKLRRLLGGSDDLLETLGDGYALRQGPDEEVDAWRFVELAEQGRRFRFAGEIEPAIRMFAAAESLWQGATRVRFRVFGDSLLEATHLEDELRMIRESRARLAVELGEDPAALVELSSLAREDPFNEELRGFLANTLSRSGRRAEALSELAALRKELRRELGIDPSPEIERIERSILDRPRAPTEGHLTGSPSQARVVTAVRARLAASSGETAALARAQSTIARIAEAAGAAVRELPGEGVLAYWGLDDESSDHVDIATGFALTLLEATSDDSDRIELRIGLASGRLVLDADDPTGSLASSDVVHRAAMLSLVGDSWTVVADADVTEALARRGFIAAIALGGGSYRLDRDYPRVAPSIRLIGREPEMEILDAAWERVVSERRFRSLLVRGASGQGKTELAQQFAGRRPGAEVLRIDCYPNAVGSGVAPIRAALRSGQRRTSRSEVQSIEPPLGDPEEDIDSLLEIVARAGERGPVLLVVDDLQWADDLLLKALARVALALADAPGMMLALAREDFLPDQGSFVPTEAMELGPLVEETAGRLLEELLPGGSSTTDRGALLHYAQGNPFVIQQLAQHLAPSRAIRSSDRQGAAPSLSLEIVFEDRIRRLPPGARSLLDALAVFGRPAKASWLRSFTGDATAGDGQPFLDILVHEGFARSDRSGARLAHDLLAELVIGAIPPERLATLHVAVAEALAEVLELEPERDAAVGTHLAASIRQRQIVGLTPDPQMRERTAEALTRAARRALRNGDPHATTRLARTVLELEELSDVERAQAIAVLATGLTDLGELGEAFEELERARSAAKTPLANAILDAAKIGSELYWSADPDYLEGARDRLTAALRTLRDNGHRAGETNALVTLAHVRYLSGELRAADQAIDGADSLMRLDGYPIEHAISASLVEGALSLEPGRMEAIRAKVESARGIRKAEQLAFLAGLEGLRGEEATSAALFRRARAIGSRGAVPIAASLVEMEAGGLAFRIGQHSRALTLLRRSERPLAQVGERMMRSTVFALMGRCLTRTGRPADGLAAAERALALAFNGDIMSQALGASGQGLAMARLGDIDGGLRHAKQGVSRVAGTEFQYIIAEAKRDLALVYVASHDIERARAELVEARSIYASRLAAAAAAAVDRELEDLEAFDSEI